jgi:predicted AAA+ superfamily ATPase
MNRIELKEIILDQAKGYNESAFITRDDEALVDGYVKNKQVIILSGIRRCGKSTFLKKINSKFPGYYLNFDDERLVHFAIEDFQLLHETFIEIYGERTIFYFDEIQNVASWERYVRRIHDEGKKVFVTGSNATMLSRELGTHLTGRYLEIKLYPFSFMKSTTFFHIAIKALLSFFITV